MIIRNLQPIDGLDKVRERGRGWERSIVRRSQNLVGKSCVFSRELVEEVVEELALRLPAPVREGSRIVLTCAGWGRNR